MSSGEVPQTRECFDCCWSFCFCYTPITAPLAGKRRHAQATAAPVSVEEAAKAENATATKEAATTEAAPEAAPEGAEGEVVEGEEASQQTKKLYLFPYRQLAPSL